MSVFDDTFNDISYVELNKRRRGDANRSEGDKLINRISRPKVKKIYVKRSGEDVHEKPKLFVWRQWQSPKLVQLLEEVGPYVGLDDGAAAIYSLDGEHISDPDEINDLETYYISGDEEFAESSDRRRSVPDVSRSRNEASYTSLSAPEFYTSNSVRSTYPANLTVPQTPPPRPYTSYNSEKKSGKKVDDYDLSSYDNYYEDAILDEKYDKTRKANSSWNNTIEFDENPNLSEFDNEMTIRRDREALEKHRQKMAQKSRRDSSVIFNRRDQTHPDAYIIYIFLNGQGMECQHMNFQRKQLEKGMSYVLELIARRYNVNPAKLVDMDGRKIHEVTQLMSRGSYVLIPVGQSFRDTWYFLPDNAIDTSSNRSLVEERSAQRDRLMQRRQKREKIQKSKKKDSRSRSSNPKTSNQNIKFNGRSSSFQPQTRNYR